MNREMTAEIENVSVEIAVTTGTLSTVISYRSSAKYADTETGLIYYGYRYYQPSVGRWTTVEPLAQFDFYSRYVLELPLERRRELERMRLRYGFSGYVFVNNIPVGASDMDGARLTPDGEVAITEENRRTPPKGMKLVQVPKCQILLIYGHNWASDFSKSGIQNIWNIVPKDDKQVKGSAYAAVITCNAHLVPNEIPLPGYTPVSGLLSIKDSSEPNDLAREAKKATDAAESAAKDICKLKCGCKKVHVEVDSWGLSIGEMLSYPSPGKDFGSFDVDCKDAH